MASWILFLSSTSFLAYFSAVYIESANYANFSLIDVSCKLLPSACNLICRGIVYPLAFFQFEMQGGIFQSYISFTVSFLGGDLIMVGGGLGGAPGILLCLNLAGSKGSSAVVEICTILY